jgi:hypothetical protein
MNIPWHSLAMLLHAPPSFPFFHKPSSVLGQAGTPGGTMFDPFRAGLGTSLAELVRALVILVVGWLLAWIIASAVKWVLRQTQLDNQLARWLTGDQSGESPPIEKWIARAVFWIIFIFAIVAFLQTLNLTAVSEPLNQFLNQVIGYLPKLAGAAILLAVAWLVATLVKLVVTRSLHAFGLDDRLGQQMQDRTPPPTTPTGADPMGTGPRDVDPMGADPMGGPQTTAATAAPAPTPTPSRPNQFSLSESIGNALYWFIFLLFLPAILRTLELQGTLEPVQQLLNDILSILPNVLAALLIGAVGWFIAQVVRRIVTNFLMATGVDRIGSRFGLGQTTTTYSLSWIIGTIIYVLILIPTAIAALNALEIAAISGPAISMLEQILNVLPQIFTAAVILILAYVVGQFLSDLVTNILTGLGFNNLFQWLGFRTQPSTPSAQPEVIVVEPQSTRPTPVPTKTPSEIVGIIVWVGVMLFATVAAVNILNIPALTALIAGIIVILGQILAGLIVFAIGLYFANLAFSLIVSSGGRQSRILGQAARVSIIALVSAMALQQMGVATSIVNLAFGLLAGAIAVAIAIAFGLGGRDIASEQIREWLNSFKRDDRTY